MNFFKPNPSSKGSLASFSFNSKEQSMYLQLVRQTSWNAEKRQASFKGGAQVRFKFNAAEIGGFLRTLRQLKESKFFHTNPQKKTSFSFGPYKAKDAQDFSGFGFSATVMEKDKDNEIFRIPFTFDEGLVLEEYFCFVLSHFFTAQYAEDKARAKAYAENKPKQDSRDSDAPEPAKSEDKPDDEDLF